MDMIIEAKDIVKTFKLKKQSIFDKQAFFTAVDRVSVRIPRKKNSRGSRRIGFRQIDVCRDCREFAAAHFRRDFILRQEH